MSGSRELFNQFRISIFNKNEPTALEILEKFIFQYGKNIFLNLYYESSISFSITNIPNNINGRLLHIVSVNCLTLLAEKMIEYGVGINDSLICEDERVQDLSPLMLAISNDNI